MYSCGQVVQFSQLQLYVWENETGQSDIWSKFSFGVKVKAIMIDTFSLTK